MSPRVSPPPAETVALTALRLLPNGGERQFTATTFPADPYRGCEHFVRMCGAIGAALDGAPGRPYALLDAIDDDGDILATWDVPTAQAFRFIYRKLRLRVTREAG